MSFPSLPNYTILREIGEGGMGIVYLAKHRIRENVVAVKVLHSHLARDPQFKLRFENEARLMAHLKHPNIVEWYDFYEMDSTVAMIMEYIDGRTLDQMIGRETGPIPYERAIPMFVQLLEGVGYAHSKGVIHRDIKPSNILVTKEGQLKITDFGIAKIAGSKGMTKTGTKVGTLFYMSPEQIQGVKELGVNSDIYALGVTLYEMLAGRLPFNEEDTEYGIMKKVVEQAFPPPSTFYPAIPKPIEDVVMKAISKRKEDRFSDCAAFKQALENAVTKSIVKAQKEEEKKSSATQPEPIIIVERKVATQSVSSKSGVKKKTLVVTRFFIAILSFLIIFYLYDHYTTYSAMKYAETIDSLLRNSNWDRWDTVRVNMIQRAATRNHAKAQLMMGWMYQEGRGVPQNDAEAVKWYRKATEQGLAAAQSNLGWMYANGRGVPQNDAEAVKWFRKAAEQGHANAQNNLGWMYEQGRGVPRDDKEAVKWYRKAAEQGHAAAQTNLGWMYEQGRGVPKDIQQAIDWYEKAAAQGDVFAKIRLKLLRNRR
ncbi:MAG: serine/threonine-protein kinase [bacterium]|nr:serine/threonine-protein kinase [bacterium]